MIFKFKLKNPEFEAIKVTCEPNQFWELKDFCGDCIRITYETASTIGCFWNITLYDALKDKEVTVPYNNYILKLSDDRYTTINTIDAAIMFETVAN